MNNDLDFTYHVPATQITYFYDEENKVLGAKNCVTGEVIASYVTYHPVDKESFKKICRGFFLEIVNDFRKN